MQTWVETSDGVRLAVDHVEPAGRPEASVVVAHGFSASRSNGDVIALRDALLEDGLSVFVYDSRGHGHSDGICTLGDDERHDVAAVAALAHERSRQVVLVGASMGAIAVLRYAAEVDRDLAGVVAVSSPAEWRMPWSFHGVFSVLLTRTQPGRWLLGRHGIRVARRWTRTSSPLELMAAIDAPVAIVHGRHDRFIKPEAAVTLHNATRNQRRLDLVAGMGHAFDPVGIPAIRAAIAWTLGPLRQESPSATV